MASKVKQVRVYAKITLILLIGAIVGVIIVKNWQYKTNFWPGADTTEVPTLWLIAATSVISVILFWILLKVRSVFKELAQLRAQRAAEARLAEQDRIRQALNEQERRIDEKLKKALDQETDREAGSAEDTTG